MKVPRAVRLLKSHFDKVRAGDPEAVALDREVNEILNAKHGRAPPPSPVLSERELPSWVVLPRPTHPWIVRVLFEVGQPRALCGALFEIMSDGRMRFVDLRAFSPRRPCGEGVTAGDLCALPPEVLVAAGVEAMRRRMR